MKVMFLRYLAITALITTLGSCTDQTSSGLFTYLNNNSGHNLALNFYKDGTVYSGLSPDDNAYYNISLNNQETKKVDTSGDMGIEEGSGYLNRISSMDSAIVTFDGNKKAVHYPFNKAGKNPDGLPFANPHNLFNQANYEEKILVDTDKRFEAEYRFSFTEQDFLNAK